MKKRLTVLLVVLLALSLCACAQETVEAPVPTPTAEPAAQAPAPVAEEVRGVTVPAFTVSVNGKAIDNTIMAAYPVYSVQASSINSSGTASTTTYAGFKLSDVLAAAGLTENYIWLEASADDGYAITFTDAEVFADTTLLAVTNDGSPFAAAPWFAPCANTTTGNYLKNCVSILVNTVEGKPEVEQAPATEETAPAETAAGLPEISDRTDKVTFEPYAFKVNGMEVTNETLAGLSIYKISVNTVNKKGETEESGYTGYKLLDVLTACGVAAPKSVKAIANDGYESALAAELIESDYTLVAIEMDKETGEDGTIWLAPCSETEKSAYCKLVVEIIAE